MIQREAKPDEIAFLVRAGTVSVAATLRGMARAPNGKLALVEMKAVDRNYPMLGDADAGPEMPMAELLAERDGVYRRGALIRLCWRDWILKSAIASRSAAPTFEIRSAVNAEPDKLAGGSVSVHASWSADGLRATGLLQPGSLVRWIYRVRLPQWCG